MTITISITCDGCGVTTEAPAGYEDAVDAIDEALDLGWVHLTPEDYCPNCSLTIGQD